MFGRTCYRPKLTSRGAAESDGEVEDNGGCLRNRSTMRGVFFCVFPVHSAAPRHMSVLWLPRQAVSTGVGGSRQRDVLADVPLYTCDVF